MNSKAQAIKEMNKALKTRMFLDLVVLEDETLRFRAQNSNYTAADLRAVADAMDAMDEYHQAQLDDLAAEYTDI